jgi:uncharacterized protein (DUF1697 family)
MAWIIGIHRQGGTVTGFRHVALMRGINVGKAKRIAMADLRALAEGLGYTEVATLLNSGNLVFSAAARSGATAAACIQACIDSELGVACKVTVLSAPQWQAVLDDNPLTGMMTDPSRLLVAVWRDSAGREATERFMQQDWAPDAVACGRHAAYLWCSEGILASRAAVALDRQLRDGITSRNWATALKIQALLAAR